MQDIRGINRATVIAELLRSRPVSRSQIAQRTNISAATVSRAVDLLIEDGLVHEVSSVVTESRGRRPVLLDFVADTVLVAGIDLGAASTRMVITDFVGTTLWQRITPTPTTARAEELARWVTAELTTEAGALFSRVRFIDVGLPGAVNRAERTVSNAPNLPAVEDPGFIPALERELALPLGFDNDVNYALLGEMRFGSAHGHSTAAMLSLGAGLGAALAIDGTILHGNRGLVGEFGALPSGPTTERVEQFVTGPGIMRRALDRGCTLSEPAELFNAEPSIATTALRAEFDHALLVVLTAITVSCESEIIILGGGIARSLTPDLERYEAALRSNLQFSPTLVHPQLGEMSGAIGAAVASLHRAYLELGVPESDLIDLPSAPERAEQ